MRLPHCLRDREGSLGPKWSAARLMVDKLRRTAGAYGKHVISMTARVPP